MIQPNLSPDSAWSKAHDHGTTGRTGCDHTSGSGHGTRPFKATAVSRIELDDAESQYFRRSHSATEERTVPGAPPDTKLDSFAPSFVVQGSREADRQEKEVFLNEFCRNTG